MRILLPLSLLGLLAVAIWAHFDYRDREGEIDISPVTVPDLAERARIGEEERALGICMRAYQQMVDADPENAEAQLGLLRAAMRLSAVVPRQNDINDVLRAATKGYEKHRARIDPDERVLQETLREWIELRLHHNWYLARASIAMWLATRGDEAAFAEFDDLNRQGAFYRDHFSYAQRYYPNWTGMGPTVEKFLSAGDLNGRVYAGVTLLMYNRIFGVGQELLDRYRGTIRDTFIEAKADMRPDINDNGPGTPGGQTLLGLALLRDKDTTRILARMSPLEHPYLGTVLANARMWAGLDPIEAVDFDGRKHKGWHPLDREFYFRGVMIQFVDLVRAERAETDPEKRMRINERLSLVRDLADRGRFFDMTVVRINATRTFAAAYPEKSMKYHQELIDAGGAESIFGAMALPRAQRVSILLPAISARVPDYSALAAAGILLPDAVSPIQLPVPTE